MSTITKEKGHLLIVEDEIDIRELLDDSLSHLVAKIDMAKDGEEAYEKIRANHYDAVLSDINMPRMTGLQLLEKIRSEGNFVPFVILTAYGDKEKTLSALKNGAMDFLDKPWTDRVLKEVITQALELGIELRRWEDESDAVANLEELRKETSAQAIERLSRVASSMANELRKLRTKIDNSGGE